MAHKQKTVNEQYDQLKSDYDAMFVQCLKEIPTSLWEGRRRSLELDALKNLRYELLSRVVHVSSVVFERSAILFGLRSQFNDFRSRKLGSFCEFWEDNEGWALHRSGYGSELRGISLGARQSIRPSQWKRNDVMHLLAIDSAWKEADAKVRFRPREGNDDVESVGEAQLALNPDQTEATPRDVEMNDDVESIDRVHVVAEIEQGAPTSSEDVKVSHQSRYPSEFKSIEDFANFLCRELASGPITISLKPDELIEVFEFQSKWLKLRTKRRIVPLYDLKQEIERILDLYPNGIKCYYKYRTQAKYRHMSEDDFHKVSKNVGRDSDKSSPIQELIEHLKKVPKIGSKASTVSEP